MYFYESAESLVERLYAVVQPALAVGNSVVIVARPENRRLLIAKLDRAGFDLRPHVREGRFTMYDADELLNAFMIAGMPDPKLFNEWVISAIRDSYRLARGSQKRVIVFGEMVSLLWEIGNQPAALALEHLWNQALLEGLFYLHCGYQDSLFALDERGRVDVICAHTHVVGNIAAA